MKKLLALMLALVLALSCTLALAETTDEAPDVRFTVEAGAAIDRDVLAQALTAFGADETVLQFADTLAATLNEAGARLVVADNGFQFDLSLKDTSLISLVGEMGDTGITLGSTLIPNYLLTLSYEGFASMLQAPVDEAESELSRLDLSALTQALSGHVETFIAACQGAVVPGDPETGDFLVNGVQYNLKMPLNVDIEAIVTAFNRMIVDVDSDEAVQAALKSLAEQGVNVQINMDDDPAPIDADSLPVFTMDVYTTLDRAGNVGDTTDVVFTVTPADAEEVATMGDVLVQGERVTVNVQLPTADTRLSFAWSPADDGFDCGLDVYAGEFYAGLHINAGPQGDALGLSAELYLMDSAHPLISKFATVTMDGERADPLAVDGKTVVSLDALLGGEDTGSLTGLLMDAVVFGVTGVVQRSLEAMPDEVNALFEMLNPTEQADGDDAQVN